jgi:FAD-dependent oxidoreductase domain-containing protein 1
VMRRSHETQQSCGVSWMELMEVERLKQKFPWLNTDNIELGSFGHENEGYFDPWSLLMALKGKAISQGVDYIDGEVTSASVDKASNGQVSINSIGLRRGTDSEEEIVPGVVVNVSYF